MELGALVCIPNGEPRCAQCPWETVCVAHQKGLTDVIPVKKKAARRRIEKKTVVLLFKENRVALVKRQEKGLLAGMWQFPMLDGYLTLHDTAEQVHKLVGSDFDIKSTCQAKHIFSHVEWQMKGRVVKLNDAPPKASEQSTRQASVPAEPQMRTKQAPSDADEMDICWVTLDEMETKYSIPSAFAAYREVVRRELGE
jgi:A/G-specific adenine glycosylase